MLFELITSGRCDAVYQTPRMWVTWQIEGRTSEGVAFTFRLGGKFVQRFVSAGLLIETDSEKVLTPSTDVEWIPVGEKEGGRVMHIYNAQRGQLGLHIPEKLLVDNFAGGGGASLGMEMAFGRPVDIAINHNEKALGMHYVNHPDTDHYIDASGEKHPLTKADQVRLVGNSVSPPVAAAILKANIEIRNKVKVAA